MPKSVVVVGAGISGLCTAYWLKKQGAHVLVLEKDPEPGGTMKTLRDGQWLIETGPNSALETTPLLARLFDELGIKKQFLYANPSSTKRYILRRGKLLPLPLSPVAFLSSRLWSVKGKLRLLGEPFRGRANVEETVADFVRRRLGKEFLDYAVNPFVSGVYAGDPKKLSVQSAFPKLYALEEQYGSLLKGAILSHKERKARKEVAKDRARLFSFVEGMQTIPKAIASFLGESVKLNCSVERIIPMRAGRYPSYTISYRQDGVSMTAEASAVVLSAQAFASARIIYPIDPEMARELESIYYPPVAEVFLGFKRSQVRQSLDGFGFLVPEVEQRNILGSIWSSSLFPRRAPEGFVAFTSFIGGARQPELIQRDDEELARLVLEDVNSIMGIEGKPIYRTIIRWDRAIPQYNLGYHKILKAIERFEQNFRGAFICSNYRGGIAVGDCVVSAANIANKIIQL